MGGFTALLYLADEDNAACAERTYSTATMM